MVYGKRRNVKRFSMCYHPGMKDVSVLIPGSDLVIEEAISTLEVIACDMEDNDLHPVGFMVIVLRNDGGFASRHEVLLKKETAMIGAVEYEKQKLIDRLRTCMMPMPVDDETDA